MNKILIHSWGISSQLIINEAHKKHLQTEEISRENNLFSLNNDKKTIYFKSVDCGLNSSFGLKIADNKELTYKIAQENNIRVPRSIYIDRVDMGKISEISKSLVYPVISKPIDGARGDGVAVNLNSDDELRKGVEYSFQDTDVNRVVIQEQIKGEDHRILVIKGKVVAVTMRIPPYVVGDGKSTISELIEKENKNPLRGDGGDHDAPMSNIKVDSECISHLDELGYTLESVLESTQQINVRKNANLSTGGLAIDKTTEIHPSVKAQAEKIAQICDLGFSGVDFFCEDISQSLEEGKGAIIEINATPGIRMHHFPSQGEGVNVAKILIEAIFD
ncbi:ATP-grasp domain-containing protein [Candidatus Gracilibacteria bacterium]|nr:ATP-grasp domain-containing protein [Candidatus Gracilibacteria bacterium]